MPDSPATSGPSPDRIMGYAAGGWIQRTLATAVELGIFAHVAAGRDDLSSLREATESSERGLRMLVDALVSLGLLTREGQGTAARLRLPADAAEYLVPGRPHYVGALIVFSAGEVAGNWSRLTEAVRTGRPVTGALDRPAAGIPFWRELVGTLFPVASRAAAALGAELLRLHPHGLVRILDVAAGSGVWGIQVAKQDARVRVTAMDLPETLEITREFVDRHSLAGQFDYLPGDLRQIDFGSAAFDAAILGQICHSEGAAESRRLITRTAAALRPGGTLVIAERFADADRRENVGALLFALNMLVHTSEGDTWSVPEVSTWLADAGFVEMRSLAVPAPEPLLLATRKLEA